MWRLKQLIPKEQTGLEGRTIDIGNLKVIVRHAIAEGGFSFVYLARDAVHGTKQYALKHIICNDEESLQAVKTEILVMKSLKGHPNVVTLHAHAFFDMGRTKEAFLVMEYCDKSLVGLLESRGAGYFEEKQILVMFRDICNAVFAMHCQSPPIAHRDLKAENVLIGSDGLWKLCDFGSTSTNHKRFERPEEMGIEEDNIRKHTTPAYRAPEMWDLYRREVINEKVDIWALGCLLFRICYFKSAFDGESKLQILNGNYRIPELPKYSSSITDLIKDMLQSPPEVRPDITQVWFRVNDLLPDELQKSLPDRPPKMTNTGEIIRPRYDSEPSNHNAAKPGGPLGAFWSTEHAKESPVVGDTIRSRVDGESGSHTTARNDRMLPERQAPSHMRSQSKDESNQSKNVHGKSVSRSQDGYPKDVEVHFLEGSVHVSAERPKAPKSECTPTFQNDAFDTFVAEFDTNKTSNSKKSHTETEMESEVERLKEQLKQANLEKAGVTSKCEKLAAICRSQREEIQELKQALAARTPPNREVPKGKLSSAAQPAVTKQQTEKSGTMWELQEDLFSSPSPSPEPQQWQAFAERPPKKKETTTAAAANRSSNSGGNNSWGFETDSFTATPTSSPPMMFKPMNEANSFRSDGVSKKVDKKSTASQPSGWAGF